MEKKKIQSILFVFSEVSDEKRYAKLIEQVKDCGYPTHSLILADGVRLHEIRPGDYHLMFGDEAVYGKDPNRFKSLAEYPRAVDLIEEVNGESCYD
ncbi:MAG: hypothetical protein WDN09_02060 [bacterium]